jgi:hypothetical protein
MTSSARFTLLCAVSLSLAAPLGCGGEATGGVGGGTGGNGAGAGAGGAVRSAPIVRQPLVAASPRLILFEGQAAKPADLPAPRHPPYQVEPALPAGLSLDSASGAVRGTPRAAREGRVHRIRDARGRTATLWVEVLARPTPQTAVFVAGGGADENPGTAERPLRTLAAAARRARPGTTIYLRGGVHRGAAVLRNLRGTADRPIAIRSFPGERAVLDASEPVFADNPRQAWRKASGPGAHPDEWESTRTFPVAKAAESASRGAFLDRPAFTRLLTYSRIEDLRAGNETFAKLAPEDRRRGPRVAASRALDRDPSRPRRPWVYCGPGIHYDKATGRIHIRLSPTRHGVAGLEEYRGPRDPREVPLAISSRADQALALMGAEHVRVTDLGLYHGGDETVLVQKSSHVRLDHVEIRAATFGLSIIGSSKVQVFHSRIDGGMPPWTFRSDFKSRYKFENDEGEVETNNVVRKTQRTLLYMGHGNADVEVAYSELENGHDVYVTGARTEFHHNRIRNVHDEAIFMPALDLSSEPIRIHHNVIEKSLSGLSFADRTATSPRYIYRNLFDLREPTAGFRPGEDRDVWRYGHVFKSAGPIGALYFYQNTALVARPREQAAFLHFGALERDGVPTRPRWFFNNLFAVVAPGERDRAMSLVPHPRYLQAKDERGRPLLRSDGNLWVRAVASDRPMFRCISRLRGERCQPQKFPQLADLARAGLPGQFEAHSRAARDPGFRRISRLDVRSPDEDLRPRKGSPALGGGISLPRDWPDPERPSRGAPDIGAFAADEGPLRVGVDGRHTY